jgi:hypothetical protein
MAAPPSSVPPAPPSVPPAPTPTATPRVSRTKPKAVEKKPVFTALRIAAAAPGNKLIDVEKIDCPTCASGSRLQYVGQGHGVVLRLRHVAAEGRRTLIIVYESENTRPLTVVLPDGETKSLTLPGTGNWTTPARHEMPIDLPAGDSEIKFFHANRPAPDLDQFIIQ